MKQGFVLRTPFLSTVLGCALSIIAAPVLADEIWAANQGDEACAAQMVAPNGEKTFCWGSFTISFVRTQFPSDWAGTSGPCFSPQDSTISGHVPDL